MKKMNVEFLSKLIKEDGQDPLVVSVTALELEKFNNLFLYILYKLPEHLRSLMRIYKIMWFSEVESMYQFQKPLTESSYRKYRFGCIPEWFASITIEDGYDGKRFSKEEYKLIDLVIDKVNKSEYTEVYDFFFDSMWISRDDNEVMDKSLYTFKPVYTEEQRKSVIETAEKLYKEMYW